MLARPFYAARAERYPNVRLHLVEGLSAEDLDGFGTARVLDADFGQHAQRQRMDVPGRLRARAESGPAVRGEVVDDGFSHLRAAGIAGAQEQDAFEGRGVARYLLVHSLLIRYLVLGIR